MTITATGRQLVHIHERGRWVYFNTDVIMEQSLVKQLDAPVAEFDLVTIPGAGRQEKYLFNYLLRHHREYLFRIY